MNLPPETENIKNAIELAKLVYPDLLQPSFKQIGKALSTVLGLGNTVLLPIKMLNEKIEARFNHHMSMYKEALENVSEQDIVPVHPEIGVPILERFTYVQNDELSKMFVNLLAKASVEDSMNLAHPSFVWAIDNLTPDEAKLIESLLPRSRIYYMMPVGETALPSNEIFRSPIRYSLLEDEIEFSYPENILFYLDNLSRIGIIHDPLGGLYSPKEPEILDRFKVKYAQELDNFKEKHPNIVRVEPKISFYEFTDYGLAFREAVLNLDD